MPGVVPRDDRFVFPKPVAITARLVVRVVSHLVETAV
jgi:hypothetical protein